MYVTGGVESCMGRGARSCMEQMVSNRVYGMRCEVVYGTGGVESCMGVGCNVVYGIYGVESCIRDDVRGRVWNRWCRIMYGCEM